MKYTLLLAILFLPLFSVHAASTYHYTCIELHTDGTGITCSGISMNAVFSGGSNEGVYDFTPNFNLTSGIWYASISTTLGGYSFASVNDPTTNVYTSSITNTAFNVTNAGGFYINNCDTSNCSGSPTFSAGSVTDLCVTDTPGDCEGGGGGGGATTTASTTTVDNPTQDLFNGILLFFLSAGFIIFIFKKRT